MSRLADIMKEKDAFYRNNYLSGISIDCVVFGYHEKSLKILLLKMKGAKKWGLPGGFVRKDLPIQEAASQILEERTGAKNIYLHQFKAFGNLNRSEDLYEGMSKELWFNDRFVSLGYYSLVNFKNVSPVVDDMSDECEWRDINDLPPLMMDHEQIFDEALIQLRRDLNYKPVGLNLLPEKFTMSELQKLYEIILDKELNRGNFYRKMTRYGILNKLDEIRKGGAHKSPNLYTFDLETYNKALENGLQESW
ncbi:NUDIX hydrolase [Chondrinema litorale]|uniref:NUDIX hydrolase n=1 Tax=Chondrinema litorale TaxID=2994555 RepID=UPI00254285F3|nr:NUDIX domain-containing protein [Chondrinema litorale]UZR92255.1 NUDIX domain-containing protein [Chondrinema litorale]